MSKAASRWKSDNKRTQTNVIANLPSIRSLSELLGNKDEDGGMIVPARSSCGGARRRPRRVGGAEVGVALHGEEAVEGEVVVVLGQAIRRHGVRAARAAARAVLRDPAAAARAGNRRFWPLSALHAHTKAP